MSEVLSFRPYAATIDMSVELPLITMQVTLVFGPFNSQAKAAEWLGEVESHHRVIEASESRTGEEVFDKTGLPTAAFVRSYVHHTDVISVREDARKKGNLLECSTPEEDARVLHVFALRAILDAVSMGLDSIERSAKL